MRRVVLTPTFAAGLGVVVAAMLAYPMRTVFLYASPNGATCKVISCGINSQAGGLPASGPTHRLNTRGPASAHTGSNGDGSPARHGSAGGGGRTLAASPRLSYRTSSRAQWGFDGTIVITFKPKFAHQRWRLRFGYPAARILRVWAGGYLHIRHDGPHAAVVASLDSAGTFPRLVRVSIEVAGLPGPPGQCTFNGRSCHFGGRHAGQEGPAGGGGHKSSGGGGGHKSSKGGRHKHRNARGRKPANAVS